MFLKNKNMKTLFTCVFVFFKIKTEIIFFLNMIKFYLFFNAKRQNTEICYQKLHL